MHENSITVTTKAVTEITEGSAKTGGTVTCSGYSVGGCGVCYGESHNPDLNDNFTKDREGAGSFNSTLNGLKSSTTYYVRTYAKTSSGIEYGNEESFTTQGGYTINVFANPTGGGTVTGAGAYQSGQSCTVTATANTGYTFTNWMENGTIVSTNENYTFTVTGSKNLTANFNLNSYSVSVSAEPQGGGTVSGGGNFGYGHSCTVRAAANSGYFFTNWTENGIEVSSNANYTFTVLDNRNLVANFHVPTPPTGAIHGAFSVSANTQVWFSQGNLQYQASTNTWRFAEHQWDYVGSQIPDELGNAGGTVNGSDNCNISPTYNGWIDLFCWGTSGYNHGAECYQPWSTSTTNEDYFAYGSSSYNLYDRTGKADWGYNAISNGGNSTNMWRTLTSDEWQYILFNRSTTSNIRFAKALVNNVGGLILLPDEWSANYYSLNNTNNKDANYSSNTISASQWNLLEQHGAVFLPAAGARDGTAVNGIGFGDYWSATSNNNFVYNLFFDDTEWLEVSWYAYRGYGESVRLVCTLN